MLKHEHGHCIDHSLGCLLWDMGCYDYCMGQDDPEEDCECQKGLRLCAFKKRQVWGTYVAQSVKRLTSTSAQVMISWLVSSSPTLGSVLTAQSLEPALDPVSPSLSQKINKYINKC